MSELGPFYPTANGKLEKNTYSWTEVSLSASMYLIRHAAGIAPIQTCVSADLSPVLGLQAANIIFLESPAFVGWSYSNTTSDATVGSFLPLAAICFQLVLIPEQAPHHDVPVFQQYIVWDALGLLMLAVLISLYRHCAPMAHRPLPYSNTRLNSFGSLWHEERVVPCTGDARTAKDALNFLLGFLDCFPVYEGRPFWIAGESYGGKGP